MKRFMLPLKLTTEAIWTAGRVARKVRDTLRGGKEPGAGSQGSSGRGAGAKGEPSLPSAIVSDAVLASATPEPPGGFPPGARVVAPDGASQGSRSIPPRGIGRIAKADGGRYEFLFYGDDGIPVLITGVSGDALRGL